jgi:hypothetical protein
MKKIILLSLLVSNQLYANWADSDFTEPTIGCALAGGAMYLTSKGSSTTKLQNFGIGCVVGAAVGAVVNNYYDNKVGKQYKGDIVKLQSQLNSFVYRQAVDSSLGIDNSSMISTEVIKGNYRPDGSYQMPSLNLKMKVPGAGIDLND